MTDWLYDGLKALQTFLDKASLADGTLILGITWMGMPLIVAVHECGHALAALLTGNRVRELRVGDVDDVTITFGTFRLRLGRLRGGEVGGNVRVDHRSATPWRVLFIALAGPAANVLSAIVIAAFAVRAEGPLSVVLFLWAVANLAYAVGNLRPKGDSATAAEWNDGNLAQAAWTARGTPLVLIASSSDPDAATSVAPPAD